MKASKVFLVDDDEIFRFTTNVLVREFELTDNFFEYENGLEGFEALAELFSNNQQLPDVILLDINMPVMNGWEFLDEVQELTSNIEDQIHIYILTSSIAPEDINLSKEYPFIQGYITKPLTKADIKKIKKTLKKEKV